MTPSGGVFCEKISINTVYNEKNSPSNPGSKNGHIASQNHVESDLKMAKAYLTGHIARRNIKGRDFCIWDTEIPGFALRVRKNGTKRWIIRFFERSRIHVVTLGDVGAISVEKARQLAKQRLSQTALLGLPQKPKRQAAKAKLTTFAELVEQFLQDRPFAWKPQTERRNRGCIRSVLLPSFGEMPVETFRREDIMRWRDTRAGKTRAFNVEISTLCALLEYAEKLGLRKIGTNPARGVPRFEKTEKERYLTQAEYRRLFLRLAECPDTLKAKAIRLLMHTGARPGEITNLRWGYVSNDRLDLPDSKTGPKSILLSRQASQVLRSMERGDDNAFVFSETGKKALCLNNFWTAFRRKAGLPDVRLHDLRHSYASIAIQHGINLAHIGRLLGHALPETTQRYAHLSDQCVVDAAETVGASVCQLMGWGDVAA